jgi:streptogramin lyase
LPPYSNPEAITAGPDGNIWFLDAVHPGGTTESFVSKVGKIAPSGTITEYTLPAGYTVGGSITAGPDGNIWFMGLDMVGKITTTGNPTKYDLPTGSAQVISASIAAGPDGNLWFTEQKGVGRITPTGTITHFPITTFSNAGTPAGITAGPDGNMWFSNVIYNAWDTTTSNSFSTYVLYNGQARVQETNNESVTVGRGGDYNRQTSKTTYTYNGDGQLLAATGVGSFTSHSGFEPSGSPWDTTTGTNVTFRSYPFPKILLPMYPFFLASSRA